MMEESFVDYYDILQVSTRADEDTIGRVFRHLAKRYHPDNPQTGDNDKFNLLVKAHTTLSNPELRAAYDVQYQQSREQQWQLVSDAAGSQGFEDDYMIREKLLSLLYVQRRRDMEVPGLGNFELEQLVDCPREMMEFHIWYLKEKNWIMRNEMGLLTITADGVDKVELTRVRLSPDRLISATSSASEGRTGNGVKQIT
ncbi:MAG: J domain-containing protein [bacterium]|nr:J domain-containing protein [bacterium]